MQEEASHGVYTFQAVDNYKLVEKAVVATTVPKTSILLHAFCSLQTSPAYTLLL